MDENESISIDQGEEKAVLAQMRCDVQFFQDNEILDYSLLLGIINLSEEETKENRGKKEEHKVKELIPPMDEEEGEEENGALGERMGSDKQKGDLNPFIKEGRGIYYSRDRRRVYLFGIIDILTEYNTKKKLEYQLKRCKYGDTMSCIPPQQYGERFLDFMQGCFH